MARKNSFIVWGTLIAIILVVIIAVIDTGSKNHGANPTNYSKVIATPMPKKPDLELLSDEVTSDDYCSYITGQVKNNSAKEYTYAEIRFTLYDESGAEIGTAMDDISNFEAGGIWNYKALVTKAGATQYSFKELSGF
ncbi:MAG: FxLYD domain-containing protein [Firmicutes bacterium]|nr:FxLYD domain-containing protein [Bacillota bacterium]